MRRKKPTTAVVAESKVMQDYRKLPVKVLKEMLLERALSCDGLKAVLVARLEHEDLNCDY